MDAWLRALDRCCRGERMIETGGARVTRARGNTIYAFRVARLSAVSRAPRSPLRGRVTITSEIPRRTTSAHARLRILRVAVTRRARVRGARGASRPRRGARDVVGRRGDVAGRAAVLTHAIVGTDSLATIAVKYGVTIRDVKRERGVITDATLHARASVRILGPRSRRAPRPGAGLRRGEAQNRQRGARGDARVLRDERASSAARRERRVSARVARSRAERRLHRN